MKKNNWASNGNDTETQPVISKEKMSFEELYSLNEIDLKQYCLDNELNYISNEEAEDEIVNQSKISIMVKLNDYLLNGKNDLIESDDLNAFNKSNYNDYNYEKNDLRS